MTGEKKIARFGRIGTLAIAAVALGSALALPSAPAKAQIYLGWDFGGGLGVGIGTPPSAYGMHYCGFTPTYGPCRNPFPF